MSFGFNFGVGLWLHVFHVPYEFWVSRVIRVRLEGASTCGSRVFSRSFYGCYGKHTKAGIMSLRFFWLRFNTPQR